MNYSSSLLIVLGIIVLIYLIPFLINFGASKALIDKSEKFERIVEGSKKRILIIGDSTAVGTGASSPEKSVAGLISKDYPHHTIENKAFNGAKLEDFRDFDSNYSNYDFILIQLGANDIIYMTSLEKIENDLKNVLLNAKNKSDKVVALHSGNIGVAPFMPKPFDYIYEKRTKKVRDIYLKVIGEIKVDYVDVFSKDLRNPKRAKSKEIYAKDKLHLNDKGYEIWRRYIREFGNV